MCWSHKRIYYIVHTVKSYLDFPATNHIRSNGENLKWTYYFGKFPVNAR
jgi:hypothetical protein